MPFNPDDGQQTYYGYDGYGNPYPGEQETAPPQDDFYDQLVALYQKYYKRNPTEQEWTVHRGNPGGLSAIEQALKESLPPDENKPPVVTTPVVNQPPTGSQEQTQPVPGVPPAYSQLAPSKPISGPGTIGNTLFPSSAVDPIISKRNEIVNAILSRPAPLDQTFQDQLFEAQKASGLGMARQARAGVMQDSLQRGVQGGQVTRALGDVDSTLIRNLLESKRQVATEATMRNRESELTAAQLADQIMRGDTGLDFERWKMEEDARQKTFAANELQRQFNERMGFDWAGLNQSRNNSFLDFLIRSGAI